MVVAYVAKLPKNGRNGKSQKLAKLVSIEGEELKLELPSHVGEGEFVKVEGSEVLENWVPSQQELKELMDSVESKFIPKHDFLFPSLKDFSRKLYSASLLNRQTTMRFHNDADGISSALVLSRILPSYKQPQQSPVYSQRDAFYDLMSLRYAPLPLLVVLDFGSNKESKDAYDILIAEGVEILILDHHPCELENAEGMLVANPTCYSMGGDYTTGYLANEVAKAFGMDFEFLSKVSLAGDKSSLEYGEEHKKTALALDYAAFYTGYGNAFNIYKQIVEDKGFRDTIYQKATEKIEAAKHELSKNSKLAVVDGLKVYYFDADAVGERREFPPTGKLATILAESIEEPAIIIAYTSRLVSLRVSQKGLLDLSTFVNFIKGKISSIEGGGGHSNAASFRIREPSLKEVTVSAVLSSLEEFVQKHKV